LPLKLLQSIVITQPLFYCQTPNLEFNQPLNQNFLKILNSHRILAGF
jgi:hypothetical protein